MIRSAYEVYKGISRTANKDYRLVKSLDDIPIK